MMFAARSLPERSWLVPEVIQTSGMDCGPAVLKALLAGFGVPVNYDRLRDACQTDVDGTSITTLETMANTLGLEAEQVMLPGDHLLLPEFRTLPAIAVVRLANGFTHFVLVWRCHGPLVQVMDPGRGRVWIPRRSLLADLYRHRLPIAAADWRAWAETDSFCLPLDLRLQALKVPAPNRQALLAQARSHPGWLGFGALDAATRFVTGLTDSGTVRRGGEAAEMIGVLVERELALPKGSIGIPAGFWTIRPDAAVADGLVFEAALVVSVTGRHPAASEAASGAPAHPPVPGDLLQAEADRPERRLWQLLRKDRIAVPLALGALALVGLGATAEIFVLRHVLDVGMIGDPVTALSNLALLVLLLFLLEMAVAATASFLGRRLEFRLRQAFYEKIPILGDGYFRSRLVSDLSQRAFELRHLQGLPELAGTAFRLVVSMLFVAIGIAVIFPAGLSAALAVLGVALGAVVLHQPLVQEHEMRQRTYAGALTRFYLDALQGLVPLRSHGAEQAMRIEQEQMVVEWGRSGVRLVRGRTWISGVAFAAITLITVFLIRDYITVFGETSAVIVLLYLSMQMPRYGEALVVAAQQYPLIRITILRLLEPLAAPPESTSWYPEPEATAPPGPAAGPDAGSDQTVPAGVALEFAGVSVRTGGVTLLDGITVSIAAGEHLAIVGPSGAGKSTLAGLLLGWRSPGAGTVRADRRLLHRGTLAALRRDTAWVDAQVHLWNASVFDNLTYGLDEFDHGERVDRATVEAGLPEVLKRFESPDSPLGESGRLVSGGEGQRVRLGRGLARPRPRLAILDEPFRGLDRTARRELTLRARARWSQATLLFISHDITDTALFDRVLVLENGRIIEDGAPDDLAARPSRYRQLLEADRHARSLLRDRSEWRRLTLRDGRLEN
ncbi:MAG: ATP-binding cassette domain-containing protein [Rhodospirillaceae bacterium]